MRCEMESAYIGRLVSKYQVKCGFLIRYIDLASEVGELGKSILNASHYGREALQETPEIQMELGDCLFSLLALCAEFGIDSEQAIMAAIEKYEKRYYNTGKISSDAK